MFSVSQSLFYSIKTSPFVWKVEWFINMWKRCIKSSDSLYRRFQMQKAFLLKPKEKLKIFICTYNVSTQLLLLNAVMYLNLLSSYPQNWSLTLLRFFCIFKKHPVCFWRKFHKNNPKLSVSSYRFCWIKLMNTDCFFSLSNHFTVMPTAAPPTDHQSNVTSPMWYRTVLGVLPIV